VIAGADDPSTPPKHGRRIAEVIPGARFEIVSPAAHLTTAERPDLTTAMVLRFDGPAIPEPDRRGGMILRFDGPAIPEPDRRGGMTR
jgi:hypothetical protein